MGAAVIFDKKLSPNKVSLGEVSFKTSLPMQGINAKKTNVPALVTHRTGHLGGQILVVGAKGKCC